MNAQEKTILLDRRKLRIEEIVAAEQDKLVAQFNHDLLLWDFAGTIAKEIYEQAEEQAPTTTPESALVTHIVESIKLLQYIKKYRKIQLEKPVAFAYTKNVFDLWTVKKESLRGGKTFLTYRLSGAGQNVLNQFSKRIEQAYKINMLAIYESRIDYSLPS